MLTRIRHLRRALALAGLAVVLSMGTPPARAASGTGTVTGVNTAITGGWRASAAGGEFLSRCLASVASGGSAVPTANGAGSWIIDLGSDRTGFVSTTAHIAPAPFGPAIPTPDPTGLVFGSPTYQLHSYDLDLYFVNSGCTQVGHATTQSPNEAGNITSPARYVVVLLAFNATGSPSVSFSYSAP